jgi:fatty-acyl-CoA synthase
MEHYRLLGQDTVPGVLRALGEHYGNHEAVVADDGRATFATLLGAAERMAAGYAAGGLKPGERVGVLLPNGLRWLTAALGAHLAGLVAVPVNTWYRSSEYAYVIERAHLRVIVTDTKLFGRDVLADLADAGYGEIFGESGGSYLGALTWPAGAQLPPALPGGPAVDVPVGPGDLAAILFTSGSTAKPKPVPLRHGPLVANPREIGRRQHLRPGDRLWLSAPFFFGYGTANALPVALTHATTLCLQDRLDGEQALAFIERERCTVYYGLGPVTRILLAAPSFGVRDISSLRTGTCGFTAEDKRLVIEELGVSQACSMYGLTEGYGHSAVSDAFDATEVKLSTSGTALPTQRIRIVDDAGRPCPPGVTGEIELSGAVIDGYLDAPELDAGAFRPGGWFRSGDLGRLDEQQRLHFAGRLKEMMKIKGINIAPAEVEDILVSHPAVDQAFVMGVRGETGEEVMACVLVPREPGADRDGLIAEVTAHIRAHAASYKVPGRFVVMNGADLPLTDTGKVSKLKLREVLDA